MHQPQRDTGASQAFIDELVLTLPRLRAFAYCMARTRADADDLLQSTAVRALAAHHQFQPGTNMRAWLYRILRNDYLDMVRSPQRNAARFDELPENFFPVKASQEQSIESRDVMRCIRKLAATHREALLLSCVEGLSYDEIAETQGCKVGTIKSRIFRARQMIKEMLGHPDPSRGTA